MFGTLRWRLTLWYGGVAIVLLILFALIPLVFYVTGASGPRAEQTSQVRLIAENAERLLQEGDSPDEVVQKLRAPNLQVIVLGTGGKVLASTPGAEEPHEDIGLPPDSYPAVRRSEGYFATSLKSEGSSGENIEVYAGVPVRDDPFVRRLVISQLLGLLAALGLMVGLGPTLAAAALKPLRRVNEVAGELREGRLESRVDLPALKSRKDEVGQVAASFDDMAMSLEKLFAAERESKEGMSRFLADASHELRTPLTSILGYLDVLEERGDVDPAIRERAYAAMKEEGGRMARLVEDLLTLARLESRQEVHEARLEPTDLVELTRGTIASYPGRRIKISGVGPVVVVAEPESLRRVISNLLSNAVKHTTPENEIEVSAKRLEGEAILRVSDEGEGIPREDLPHVFERFYQAEASRFGEGTGLGLTIVKETVENLGGHVEVESSPGEGATFTVCLPLSDAT